MQTFEFKECEMGTVKLIVIYPCPKDIESFERVYKERTCAHGRREACRQDKNCGEQNSRFPARDTALPSHCRDPFPLHGGSASLRRIGRPQTDARECSGNFFRRRTDLPGRRRGSIRVSREVTYRPRLPPQPQFRTPAPALYALVFPSEGL